MTPKNFFKYQLGLIKVALFTHDTSVLGISTNNFSSNSGNSGFTLYEQEVSRFTQFWLSLCHFRTDDYISKQALFLPYPSPPYILSAQTILLYTQTQCSFVTRTHRLKMYLPPKCYLAHSLRKEIRERVK